MTYKKATSSSPTHVQKCSAVQSHTCAKVQRRPVPHMCKSAAPFSPTHVHRATGCNLSTITRVIQSSQQSLHVQAVCCSCANARHMAASAGKTPNHRVAQQAQGKPLISG
eukprot:scpid106539/ scgid24085/ 